MTNKTALGDRMKRYEAPCRHLLPRRTYTIIRVDGKAFHSLLRHANKPFDTFFMECMAQVARVMCPQLAGCQLAYLQSDEISFLLTDFASHGAEPWMGGVIQKMASIAGAMATDEFAAPRSAAPCQWACSGSPGLFDARAFTIPDPVEVANYFIWRQRDAVRNSISMAAQAHFPHDSLQHLSGAQMLERLFAEAQVNWNDYPVHARRGAVVTREEYEAPGGSGTLETNAGWQDWTIGSPVMRHRWTLRGAPHFRAEPGSFLSGLIPPLPSLAREAGDAEGDLASS